MFRCSCVQGVQVFRVQGVQVFMFYCFTVWGVGVFFIQFSRNEF